jgi:hypothetical protein
MMDALMVHVALPTGDGKTVKRMAGLAWQSFAKKQMRTGKGVRSCYSGEVSRTRRATAALMAQIHAGLLQEGRKEARGAGCLVAVVEVVVVARELAVRGSTRNQRMAGATAL